MFLGPATSLILDILYVCLILLVTTWKTIQLSSCCQELTLVPSAAGVPEDHEAESCEGQALGDGWDRVRKVT